MYWLSRPPYLRWMIAALIVGGALYLDLTGPPTEPYPFAAAPAAAGEPLAVDWREVPVGLLPGPVDPPEIAPQVIAAGVPLVPGLLAGPAAAPEGWWAVETALPGPALPGEAILVVIDDPKLEVTGVVVAPSRKGSFGATEPGLVAVPPEHAAAVAGALAANRAILLVRP